MFVYAIRYRPIYTTQATSPLQIRRSPAQAHSRNVGGVPKKLYNAGNVEKSIRSLCASSGRVKQFPTLPQKRGRHSATRSIATMIIQRPIVRSHSLIGLGVCWRNEFKLNDLGVLSGVRLASAALRGATSTRCYACCLSRSRSHPADTNSPSIFAFVNKLDDSGPLATLFHLGRPFHEPFSIRQC